MSIAISSGHGLHVPGASGIINEVTEARLVVEHVAGFLRVVGVPVSVFHDNTSRNQRDNLNAIIAWHNNQTRNLDVSIHFNDYSDTSVNGTETLHRTNNTQMRDMASRISTRISQVSGIRLRGTNGAVARDNLAVLNGLSRAVIVEVCFVNNANDVNLYRNNFHRICAAIAEAISGRQIPPHLIPG